MEEVKYINIDCGTYDGAEENNEEITLDCGTY